MRVALTDCSSSSKPASDSFGRICEALSAAPRVPLGGINFSITSEKVAPSFQERSLWYAASERDIVFIHRTHDTEHSPRQTEQDFSTFRLNR